jgi:hypothetical protein
MTPVPRSRFRPGGPVPSPARPAHPGSAALPGLLFPCLGSRPASHPGWADPRPGWAGTPPGWPSPPRPTPAGPLLALPCPVLRLGSLQRTRLGRIRRIRPGRDFLLQVTPCNPGWARLSTLAGPLLFYCSGRARPGFPGPGQIITLQGRYLPPPTYISHPAPCPSPGTPLDSDWHILHRHMLVLGRPLA